MAKSLKTRVRELATGNRKLQTQLVKKCDQLIAEQVSEEGIYDLLSTYVDVRDYAPVNHNFEELNYPELKRFNVKYIFLKTKFPTEELKEFMNKKLVFHDENLLLFKPESIEEERTIESGMPVPLERNYDRDGIYILFNVPTELNQGAECLDIVVDKHIDNRLRPNVEDVLPPTIKKEEEIVEE